MTRSERSTTAGSLHALIEATADVTGDDFFRTFIWRLARALEMEQTFVAELEDGGHLARMVAIWSRGRFVEPLTYPVAGTACERVAGGQIVEIPHGLSEVYPADGGIDGVRPESYIGIPLISQGEVIGHAVAIDSRPMVDKQRDFSALELLAVRVTAELERRRADRALHEAQLQLMQSEKHAAMGQLTAGVVHELNSPLGVLRGSSDLARRSADRLRRVLDGGEQELSEPQRRSLQRYMGALDRSLADAVEAGERIADVVANLRRFTRLDETGEQLVRLNDDLDAVLALLAAELPPSVTVVRDYDALPPVLISPAELNEIFMTLLRNAVEAIGGGDGTVVVKTSAGDGRVRVRISDTGRGISADELAGLFDVGFGTRGSRVGMRLGLSSARHVVQRSGGEIAVQSAPGQGTTFTVELPAAHPAVAGDVAATADGVSGQVAGEPPLLPSWSKDA